MATSTFLRTPRANGLGPVGDAGAIRTIYQRITLTGALALNEVHPVATLPAGSRVHSVRMTSTDMDTGGSPTLVLALGDAADNDRLMTNITIGQTGGVSTVMAATASFTYTAPTLINVTATAAAATGASGVLEVEIAYYVVAAA